MRKEYLKHVHKNKVKENSPGYENFKRQTKRIDARDIQSIMYGFDIYKQEEKIESLGKSSLN